VRQVGANVTEIGVVEPEEDSDLVFNDGHLVSGTLVRGKERGEGE
jgi:hypothetical protein